MVQRSLGQMADRMSKAAAVLRELLAAHGEYVRLRAARSVLKVSVKLREIVELEERLQALGERLAATGYTPT
jgi:hypothetical protein